MTTKDLRQKSITELKEELQKLQKNLHETAMNLLQRKEKNVKKPSEFKRAIARVKTILAEKELSHE